ncbi:hypothetical protein BIFGAL_04291 [Bifidobacterium gallicum DSM 20093 = LMG 11596]|uniref:Uncharacterized protein n=1 Tax=Bifidobacterium gallicum DSM 20093 = LMG 11596 TaxID=561180 RepID=D1NWN8_9BIFI|nr:hypothetical protein BIFGAL_04291 [Bifidobacterium gallicum DSM 20093 = LMG 11596]
MDAPCAGEQCCKRRAACESSLACGTVRQLRPMSLSVHGPPRGRPE